jgi:hypothetical protein
MTRPAIDAHLLRLFFVTIPISANAALRFDRPVVCFELESKTKDAMSARVSRKGKAGRRSDGKKRPKGRQSLSAYGK